MSYPLTGRPPSRPVLSAAAGEVSWRATAGPWLEAAAYFSRTGRSERASHRWADGWTRRHSRRVDRLRRQLTGPCGHVGWPRRNREDEDAACVVRAAGRERDERQVPGTRSPHRSPGIRAASDGRLLVVIDDAHDEDAPVGKVVTGVLAANPAATILLALRPDGEASSRRQLREAGLDMHEVTRWEVADLQLPEAEALAREVLGPENAYAAPRLAVAARDCPFLLVTGALLVRDGMVDLQRFEGDDRLRRELIESLADAVSSRATDQPEVREEVLRAVAALHPLRTADGRLPHALEALTGRAFDQLAAIPVRMGGRRDLVAPPGDLPSGPRPAR